MNCKGGYQNIGYLWSMAKVVVELQPAANCIW